MRNRRIAWVGLVGVFALGSSGSREMTSDAVSECNWMEDWWFQSEGGGGDLFYHAGYELGEEGVGTQIPTGPGEWVSEDMRATTNYHEQAEQGWLVDPPHANCG